MRNRTEKMPQTQTPYASTAQKPCVGINMPKKCVYANAPRLYPPPPRTSPRPTGRAISGQPAGDLKVVSPLEGRRQPAMAQNAIKSAKHESTNSTVAWG